MTNFAQINDILVVLMAHPTDINSPASTVTTNPKHQLVTCNNGMGSTFTTE